MRNDPKSNNIITSVLSASSRVAAVYNSGSVDHAEASAASFLMDAGTFGASATLDAKVQYSDDNVTWVDYPLADPAKNDSSIVQMTVAGEALLHVVNPRGRYSRVVATVGTAAVEFSVCAVVGPLRHVSVA